MIDPIEERMVNALAAYYGQLVASEADSKPRVEDDAGIIRTESRFEAYPPGLNEKASVETTADTQPNDVVMAPCAGVHDGGSFTLTFSGITTCPDYDNVDNPNGVFVLPRIDVCRWQLFSDELVLSIACDPTVPEWTVRMSWTNTGDMFEHTQANPFAVFNNNNAMCGPFVFGTGGSCTVSGPA